MENQNDYQEKMLFIRVYSESLTSDYTHYQANRLAIQAVLDFREFFNIEGEKDESNNDSGS